MSVECNYETKLCFNFNFCSKWNKVRWKTEKWNGRSWGELIKVRNGGDLDCLQKVEQVNDNLFVNSCKNESN